MQSKPGIKRSFYLIYHYSKHRYSLLKVLVWPRRYQMLLTVTRADFMNNRLYRCTLMTAHVLLTTVHEQQALHVHTDDCTCVTDYCPWSVIILYMPMKFSNWFQGILKKIGRIFIRGHKRWREEVHNTWPCFRSVTVKRTNASPPPPPRLSCLR